MEKEVRQVRVNVRLTPDEKEAIRATSERMGLSMSDVIRLAVREYLKKEN
jgi:antitoxin component of RelBE/YafQ-DinJ toxin-antitoxin module